MELPVIYIIKITSPEGPKELHATKKRKKKTILYIATEF